MNMYVKYQTFYAKQRYNSCISCLNQSLSIAKVSHFFYELWPFLFKVEILLNLQCIKDFAIFSDVFRQKKPQCDNIFLNRNYKGNAMTFAEGINKSTQRV